MARGLPVVVHRSGGAWTDLAEEGRYGLGYETAEEAVEALARLLLQGAKFDTAEKARELAYPKFRERLAKVLGL
jgi:glycosyltransferase involved in cell wall biosynthesis